VLFRYSLHDYLDKGVDISAQRLEKINKLIKTMSDLIEVNKANKELVALINMVEQQSRRKYGVESWKDLPLNSLENVFEKIKEVLKLNDY
jgi:hypothetical protein